MKMKRIILTLTMLVALVATASAQAEIKFDKLIHNFGSFAESNPVQKATFILLFYIFSLICFLFLYNWMQKYI